ncbi:MAG: TonB family protein [Minicystis sp.]
MRTRSFGQRRIGVVAVVAALAVAPANAVFAQTPAPGAQKQPKLTKLPKLVKFVEAAYPEEEKKSGRAASVTLEIAISETGAVVEAAVVGSAGAAFDAAALAAVKQFVFEPAEFDEKPAPVKITYRYDFVLKEEPKGPVVNFEGVVKNRFTKKPMAGAVVTIDGKLKATTDAEGHFSFTDVPVGKHAVEIAGPGVTPVTTEETIEEKKKLDAKYTVEPKEEEKAEDAADVEVVVVVPKVQKEVVSTQIVASEGRRVPGTQGDTLKVVQNLPGVARAATGSGALVVWGAAPQDTRVYVDGVRIPLLYHGGGVRATVNSDMVRSIDLIPGGYGPEYGTWHRRARHHRDARAPDRHPSWLRLGGHRRCVGDARRAHRQQDELHGERAEELPRSRDLAHDQEGRERALPDPQLLRRAGAPGAPAPGQRVSGAVRVRVQRSSHALGGQRRSHPGEERDDRLRLRPGDGEVSLSDARRRGAVGHSLGGARRQLAQVQLRRRALDARHQDQHLRDPRRLARARRAQHGGDRRPRRRGLARRPRAQWGGGLAAARG